MSFISDIIMRYKIQEIIKDKYGYYLSDKTKEYENILSVSLNIDSLMFHDVIYSIMKDMHEDLIKTNSTSSWVMHSIISKESDRLYIKWLEINVLNNKRSNSIMDDGAVTRLSLFLEKNLFAED